MSGLLKLDLELELLHFNIPVCAKQDLDKLEKSVLALVKREKQNLRTLLRCDSEDGVSSGDKGSHGPSSVCSPG